MDVSTRADVSKIRAISGVAWDSRVINPAIYAIMATEPILHPEFITGVEVAGVGFLATIEIPRMTAFRPAVAEFLLHAAACEIQPWPVEPDAQLVCAGHPD